jgi:hypothetical protein
LGQARSDLFLHHIWTGQITLIRLDKLAVARKARLTVIARGDLSALAQRAKAEATKQSILPLRGDMDCFAEPVIGRSFARPGGSQ